VRNRAHRRPTCCHLGSDAPCERDYASIVKFSLSLSALAVAASSWLPCHEITMGGVSAHAWLTLTMSPGCWDPLRVACAVAMARLLSSYQPALL